MQIKLGLGSKELSLCVIQNFGFKWQKQLKRIQANMNCIGLLSKNARSCLALA